MKHRKLAASISNGEFGESHPSESKMKLKPYKKIGSEGVACVNLFGMRALDTVNKSSTNGKK